jgi:hypothetical protein
MESDVISPLVKKKKKKLVQVMPALTSKGVSARLDTKVEFKCDKVRPKSPLDLQKKI